MEDRFLEQADDDEHFGVHVTYEVLYMSMLFLSAMYGAGVMVSQFCSMPALVGEIFMGILLGPNLLNLVPDPESWVMLGHIGYV